MSKKVLFLCHGNINRSPAAEIILKNLSPGFEVRSAGLKSDAGGAITAKKMREALKVKGFPSNGIRSSALTDEMISWADVIFYMDGGNKKRLEDKLGGVQEPKFRLLATLIGKTKIPDPNFSKGIEKHCQVIDMLSEAIQKFIEETNNAGLS